MMLAEHPIAALPVRATLTAELVLVVEQYMRDHLEEKILLEDLAETVGYSRFHFSRLFKAVAGETASHFLMRLRVAAIMGLGLALLGLAWMYQKVQRASGQIEADR